MTVNVFLNFLASSLYANHMKMYYSLYVLTEFYPMMSIYILRIAKRLFVYAGSGDHAVP